MADSNEPVPGIRVQPNGAILFIDVVGGWPKVFVPKAFEEGQTPKYQFSVLLHKVRDKARIAWVKSYIEKIAGDAKLGKLPPDKLCMRDGEYSSDEKVHDYWFITSAEATRPVVMDQGKVHLTEADSDRIKGGYSYNVVLGFWAQNNTYGKRVNANLRAIQLVKPGEIFANGEGGEAAAKAAADAFEVIRPEDVDLGV